jgi:ABC-type multidrug transport system fused ATPase/permease subunit
MNLINNIFSLLDGELKKYLLFIFIIIILTTILETLSLASFYPLLDLIINTSQIDSSNSIKIFYYKLLDYFSLDVSSILSFTIILVAALYIVKILVLLFCHWHSSNFEFAIRFYLTKKLYSIYLRKDYLSLMKYNSADIIKNIDYELNMYSSGIAALMTIVIEGLIFLGIILFLLYFNYQVTLSILLLFIFIFLLLQLSYNKTLASWGAISQKYEKLRIQNFIETFNAIKEIKVFGKESSF